MTDTRRIIFFPLLFFHVILAGAAPESFFISSGAPVVNGAVVRGYSPLYYNEILSAADLQGFTNVSGSVKVLYSNGKEDDKSAAELLKSGEVSIVPCNSKEHIRFVFNGSTFGNAVKQIQIGREGIVFFSEGAGFDNALIRENIKKILELETAGKSHSEIQEVIWRNRIPRETKTSERFIVDWQTTGKEEEKVFCTFGKNPTVTYKRGGDVFLRVDGILSARGEYSSGIDELITHYHTDHITHTALERCLRDKSFNRIIIPNPYLDVSKNQVYSIIEKYAGMTDNEILEIVSRGNLLNLKFIEMGKFKYSSFNYGKDIFVEMYRYNDPYNENTDTLIFRITHKNISYMLFGDFDAPAGIENLLDVCAANERRTIEVKEEISHLTIRLTETNANETEIKARIEALNGELKNLPALKADVMKWPHHAHRFAANENVDRIIRKMNDVVDPRYIVWERHYTQRDSLFREYILRFDFSDKFFCSEDTEVLFISLEWRTLRGPV
jgi:hypothetical protein